MTDLEEWEYLSFDVIVHEPIFYTLDGHFFAMTTRNTIPLAANDA